MPAADQPETERDTAIDEQQARNMTDAGIDECLLLLRSSKILIEQLQKSLASLQHAQAPPHDQPSLNLLKTAAQVLKSNVTKLSLLAITAPFTPSAVSTQLKSLHNSILPSLATSAILIAAEIHPDLFVKDCSNLVRAALTETKGLLETIEQRAKAKSIQSQPADADKQGVTEATGRVWAACDVLIKFAEDGVPGFLIKKADQWLALMKDAVQELQEWDPEELVDDNLFGESLSDEDNAEDSRAGVKDGDEVTVAAGVKEQALKVLQRIPQSIHVLIKQRLAQLSQIEPTILSQQSKVLNLVLGNVRRISESIDESAEAVYMGNPELCLKKAGEARAIAIDTIQAVVKPWQGTNGFAQSETKQDIYMQRALIWIQQVDTEGLQRTKPS